MAQEPEVVEPGAQETLLAMADRLPPEQFRAAMRTAFGHNDTPLVKAVLEGDLKAVRAIVERGQGVTMNLATPEGSQALITAINKANGQSPAPAKRRLASLLGRSRSQEENPYREIAHYLLGHGVDVNIPSSEGELPLTRAAGWGDVRMMQLALDKGAAVDAETFTHDPRKKIRTALMNAVEIGHTEAAALLIRHGANVHFTNGLGLQPIHAAALNGSRDNDKALLLAALIASGADFNAPSPRGTPAAILEETARGLLAGLPRSQRVITLALQGTTGEALLQAASVTEETSGRGNSLAQRIPAQGIGTKLE